MASFEWLGKINSALVGEKGQTQTGEETIDKLCDRLVHATLLEDRRAAVLGLKGLSRQYQLEVGTKGLPILLYILHQDRVDPSIAKAILETLINICDTTNNEASPNDKQNTENLGLQFTEIFVKDSKNISLLLSILAEPDFHVRFNSIEFLKVLLKNKRKALQDCILTSPMGVSRLMDLLDDHREVIRNEGLLLLIDLTNQHAEIQKIIAFENAFERLLQIIAEEGACEGNVTVQDCLHLIMNLLKDNVSNQNYFRESGLFSRFLPFFNLEIPDGTSFLIHQDSQEQLWPVQKGKNVLMAFDIIRLFVSIENPNTSANQKTIFSSSLLVPFLLIGLQPDISPAVRSRALLTLAECVNGFPQAQNYLGSCSIKVSLKSIPVPLINYLISMSVDNSALNIPDFFVRVSAAEVVHAYLEGNTEFQRAVLSTLTPPPPLNPNDQAPTSPSANGIHSNSAGSLIIAALLDWDISRKDPYRFWFASSLLGHIFMEDSKCKQLGIKVHPAEDEMDLLTWCAQNAILSTKIPESRVLLGFLSLLSLWLFKYPPAVKKFLSEGAHFSFLIELISNSRQADPCIQGAASFLLGICFEYNDDSVLGLTRAALQSIIINRVGSDQFINRLNKLKESQAFNKMEHNESIIGSDGLPYLLFDSYYLDLYKNNYENFQKSVGNPKALQQKEKEKEESQQQASIISSYKKLISDQDQEIANLKKQLKESQSESKEPVVDTNALVEKDEEIERLKNQVKEWKEKFENTQKEMEDLLVCLAEQDMEVKSLKGRLKNLGEEVSEDEEEEEEEVLNEQTEE